jgi:hypothetical protein
MNSPLCLLTCVAFHGLFFGQRLLCCSVCSWTLGLKWSSCLSISPCLNLSPLTNTKQLELQVHASALNSWALLKQPSWSSLLLTAKVFLPLTMKVEADGGGHCSENCLVIRIQDVPLQGRKSLELPRESCSCQPWGQLAIPTKDAPNTLQFYLFKCVPKIKVSFRTLLSKFVPRPG